MIKIHIKFFMDAISNEILSAEKVYYSILTGNIFIIIMGAGIVFINNGNKRAWSTARSNQALYLAEAGIEKQFNAKDNPNQWISSYISRTSLPSVALVLMKLIFYPN